MPGLAQRPYLIEEYTRTICPHCFAERRRRSDEEGVFVDGMLVSHGGKVWMRRFCPVHGETESLYEEDLEVWRTRFGWSTPTLAITPDRVGNAKGFPEGYRDGLPVSHGQHTCILLLNVTDHCNYSCPACYASALPPGSPAERPESPSLAQALHTVDTGLRREAGKLGVVMISGGEPTVRGDIEELLLRVMERNVTRVMLNTNGRRIARDDRFLKFLHDHRERIEIYLQFDGLRGSTYGRLRGEDVADEKQSALCRLNDAKVFTTLVMTVAKGVNEDEVGDVVAAGLEIPRCAGVAIQPMFGSGRTPIYDPLDRVTPTGALSRLASQTRNLVSASDFIPLPCSHKDCCDITYLVKAADGSWRSLASLIGREELKKWIHLVSNTISFENASDGIKELVRSGALQRVFSEQQKVGALGLAGDIFKMCGCVPGVNELLGSVAGRVGAKQLEKLAERTFRITSKMFMDAHTFHEARIRQCCVHVGTFEEDPRRYSFCWRWLFEDASDFPDRDLIRLSVVK
ncbi:MAG TPA: radical SAM protein [Fimbriimonadaceae bacterium]|nr:radical SAM protein [Fimbriimonadaceae bacterium]